MTDYTLVKEELMKALGCDEAQAEQYESYINSALASVAAMLKSDEDENDIRVVTLCAMKAYYQIILTQEDDGIVSFKAGDVSYTKEETSVSRAKALLRAAEENCGGLVYGGSFAFKAV